MSEASETRQPRVGDLVDVGYVGKIYHTKITKIVGAILYLIDMNSGANSAIYWKNGWYVANGTKVDSIKFRKNTPLVILGEAASSGEGLTSSQLADLEILTLTDPSTFRNLCLANKKLYTLCTNIKYQNQLYSERVKIHMPQFVHLVDSNNSWKKIYDEVLEIRRIIKSVQKQNLSHVLYIADLVDNNDLLGLKILVSEIGEDKVLGAINVPHVYQKGSVSILKFMLEGGYWIAPENVAFAAAYGKVDIIDFVNKLANSVTPSLQNVEPQIEREPNLSAYLTEIEKRGSSRLIITRTILRARDAIRDTGAVKTAAIHGQINVLDWYLKNDPNIFTGINISRGLGNLVGNSESDIAVLKWMKANELEIGIRTMALNAARNNNISILNWLESEGLFNIPEKVNLMQELADTAANSINVEIFQWALERGANVLPSHINNSLMKGDLPMLEVLYNKGIYPDQNFVRDIRKPESFSDDPNRLRALIAWLNWKGL